MKKEKKNSAGSRKKIFHPLTDGFHRPEGIASLLH